MLPDQSEKAAKNDYQQGVDVDRVLRLLAWRLPGIDHRVVGAAPHRELARGNVRHSRPLSRPLLRAARPAAGLRGDQPEKHRHDSYIEARCHGDACVHHNTGEKQVDLSQWVSCTIEMMTELCAPNRQVAAVKLPNAAPGYDQALTHRGIKSWT